VLVCVRALRRRLAILGQEREVSLSGLVWVPAPRRPSSMAPWPGFWGGGEAYRGTPVVVRMDDPASWSISEIHHDGGSDEEEEFVVTGRGRRKRSKNAKQITWVLLLEAHRAAGCLAWLASAAVALGGAARRRVAAGLTDSDSDAVDDEYQPSPPPRRSPFYAFIRASLLLSLALLAVELAAHANVLRRLLAPAASLDALHAAWVRFRAAYVAPPLQLLADACVVLFLVQSADRVVQSLGCFYIRLRRVGPTPVSPAPDAEDPDAGYYPMVLVQIPMCNEKEVTAMPHCHFHPLTPT
jgi:hypothetical protein